MPRAKRKVYQVGPYSDAMNIVNADKRSREAKALRSAIAGLTEHVGGDPGAAESMLITATAVIWVRLTMASARMLEPTEIGEQTQKAFLSWNNALRRNLDTLGIKPAQMKQIRTNLESLIETEHE